MTRRTQTVTSLITTPTPRLHLALVATAKTFLCVVTTEDQLSATEIGTETCTMTVGLRGALVESSILALIGIKKLLGNEPGVAVLEDVVGEGKVRRRHGREIGSCIGGRIRGSVWRGKEGRSVLQARRWCGIHAMRSKACEESKRHFIGGHIECGVCGIPQGGQCCCCYYLEAKPSFRLFSISLSLFSPYFPVIPSALRSSVSFSFAFLASLLSL